MTWDQAAALGTLAGAIATAWAAWHAKTAAEAARDGFRLQREAWQEEQLQRRRADLVCYTEAQRSGLASQTYLVVANRGLAPAREVTVTLGPTSPYGFGVFNVETMAVEVVETIPVPPIQSGLQHRRQLDEHPGDPPEDLRDWSVDVAWADDEGAKNSTQMIGWPSS